MKLEDQVTSLELSKRLKELGVLQDSLWCWYASKSPARDKHFLERDNVPSRLNEHKVSAFTVAELSIEMPEYSFTLYWEDKRWRCACDGSLLKYRLGIENSKGYNNELLNFYCSNPANALAMLKVNLVKRGILKV